jgi:hypothetical protein
MFFPKRPNRAFRHATQAQVKRAGALWDPFCKEYDSLGIVQGVNIGYVGKFLPRHVERITIYIARP